MSRNRQSAPLIDFELASPLLGFAEDYRHGDVIPRHRHPHAQLIHAAAGVMTVHTDDGIFVVPPERAVWVPAFVSHSIRMTGSVEIRTLYVAESASPIDDAHCCVVTVSPLLRAGLLRSVDFPNPYPEGGPEARLAGVIVDEIRTAEAAPLHLPMPRDPRARRLAEALRDAPGDRRRLAEQAREAGASERTLERLFRAEVGMTIGAFRQQARLLVALEMLASGQSVSSVALEVGFETPSAFIALFRRAMGTTPGRYFKAAGDVPPANTETHRAVRRPDRRPDARRE